MSGEDQGKIELGSQPSSLSRSPPPTTTTPATASSSLSLAPQSPTAGSVQSKIVPQAMALTVTEDQLERQLQIQQDQLALMQQQQDRSRIKLESIAFKNLKELLQDGALFDGSKEKFADYKSAVELFTSGLGIGDHLTSDFDPNGNVKESDWKAINSQLRTALAASMKELAMRNYLAARPSSKAAWDHLLAIYGGEDHNAALDWIKKMDSFKIAEDHPNVEQELFKLQSMFTRWAMAAGQSADDSAKFIVHMRRSLWNSINTQINTEMIHRQAEMKFGSKSAAHSIMEIINFAVKHIQTEQAEKRLRGGATPKAEQVPAFAVGVSRADGKCNLCDADSHGFTSCPFLAKCRDWVADVQGKQCMKCHNSGHGHLTCPQWKSRGKSRDSKKKHDNASSSSSDSNKTSFQPYSHPSPSLKQRIKQLRSEAKKNKLGFGVVRANTILNYSDYEKGAWIIDSGATQHITGDLSSLENVRTGRAMMVVLPDGSSTITSAIGDASVLVRSSEGVVTTIKLQGVLYNESFKNSLFSISRATLSGLNIKFTGNRCIFKNGRTKEKLCSFRRSNGLWRLKPFVSKATAATSDNNVFVCNASTKPASLPYDLLHARLGHISAEYVKKTVKITTGVSGVDGGPSKTHPCHACSAAKTGSGSHSSKGTRATAPLELVHSDVCGPVTKSRSGYQYYVSFVDDYSRFAVTYFMKHKSEVSYWFSKYMKLMYMLLKDKTQRVLRLRTDNGGEYVNDELLKMCEAEGIWHEMTCPHNPEQNGVAECFNKVMWNRIRSLLEHAKLPAHYWMDAASTSTYTRNRCPTAAVAGMTPFERLFGTKPDISHLRVFGCLVYVPVHDRSKVENPREPARFLGYSNNHKHGYLVQPFRKNAERRIVNAHDCSCHENEFGLSGQRGKLHVENNVSNVSVSPNNDDEDDSSDDLYGPLYNHDARIMYRGAGVPADESQPPAQSAQAEVPLGSAGSAPPTGTSPAAATSSSIGTASSTESAGIAVKSEKSSVKTEATVHTDDENDINMDQYMGELDSQHSIPPLERPAGEVVSGGTQPSIVENNSDNKGLIDPCPESARSNHSTRSQPSRRAKTAAQVQMQVQLEKKTRDPANKQTHSKSSASAGEQNPRDQFKGCTNKQTNEYVVEGIVGHKFEQVNGYWIKLYEVKWKHWGHEHNEWKPLEKLWKVRKMVNEYNTRPNASKTTTEPVTTTQPAQIANEATHNESPDENQIAENNAPNLDVEAKIDGNDYCDKAVSDPEWPQDANEQPELAAALTSIAFKFLNRKGDMLRWKRQNHNNRRRQKVVKVSVNNAQTEDPVKRQAAREAELQSLHDFDVFELVPLPLGAKLIKSGWVDTIKHDGRYKSRLVAKGYSQTQGVDFDGTWCPVLHKRSLRVLMALANNKGHKVTHMDVNNAFMNGILHHDCYIQQPEGFIDKQFPNHVWKLKRAINGLKQGGFEWSSVFEDWLLSVGFNQSPHEPCIYQKKHNDGQLLTIGVYVDDLAIVGSDKAREWFENLIPKRFKCRNLGEIKMFLGINIERDIERKLLLMHQRDYVVKVLERFNMISSKLCPTPLAAEPLSRTMCPEPGSDEYYEMRLVPYREAVGCLNYLASCTRPDIATAVSSVATYLENPGRAHWKAVQRIMRYLNGTRDLGIAFIGDLAGSNPNSALQVSGYCDSSYANEDDRHSTLGYVTQVGECGTIDWKSKSSECVATSTTEAEYFAEGLCTKELMFDRALLNGLDQKQNGPSMLRGDNEAALKLAAKNAVSHLTKHIDVRYHFIRQCIRNNEVSVEHVSTLNNIADLFTKGISMSDKFARLRTLLGMTTPKDLVSIQADRQRALVEVTKQPTEETQFRRKGLVRVKDGFKTKLVETNDYLRTAMKAMRANTSALKPTSPPPQVDQQRSPIDATKIRNIDGIRNGGVRSVRIDEKCKYRIQ